jgi:acetyl esterase/lipase
MTRKNIEYATRSKSKNMLDVYYEPGKKKQPVVFFIHGGSWMTGSKDMYKKLGENFHDKGYVSVIISYRLFPVTDVYGMVEDCRDAFKWCIENIADFGGDTSRIFMAGHSAGGHLCTVTGLLEEDPVKYIKGFILIDAFGLCANYFLTEHAMLIPDFFAGIFGKEKTKWPNASPDNLVKRGAPPFLVLTGGNTYPFVAFDNSNFVSKLDSLAISNEHKIMDSLSHMQMIYEFESTTTEVFSGTLKWMKKFL